MMKKLIQIGFVMMGLCLATFAGTPEEIAEGLAADLRTRIIPSFRDDTMTAEEIQAYFKDNVMHRVDNEFPATVPTRSGAFVRVAADSLGGGSLDNGISKETIVSALLAVTPEDLGVAENTIRNGTVENYGGYQEMMYRTGLWPAEWLSDEIKKKLGIQ